MAIFTSNFLHMNAFTFAPTEAAQLGSVQHIRTKILAGLVAQFGGPLREGKKHLVLHVAIEISYKRVNHTSKKDYFADDRCTF